MATTTLPLEQYIEEARQRLVRLEGPGETTWREVVERGLAEAYRSSDVSGLSRVVQFLVNLLESKGRFEDAEAEIDLALRFAEQDWGATAWLNALKGTVLAARGRAVEASLRQLGFAVGAARVGRVIDLELEDGDAAEARVASVQAFELMGRPPARGLVIGVSHEGGTWATNEALRLAGAKSHQANASGCQRCSSPAWPSRTRSASPRCVATVWSTTSRVPSGDSDEMFSGRTYSSWVSVSHSSSGLVTVSRPKTSSRDASP